MSRARPGVRPDDRAARSSGPSGRKGTTIMATIPSFTDLLKGAKLPEASHPVCLRADLTADFEAAERELEALRKQGRPADSLAGSPTAALVRRIEELQQEMAEATQVFRLRALPKSKWRALVAQYPPRRDEKTGDPVPEDAQIGINREDFLDALVKVSVIDPEISEEQWVTLLDTLTDRQYSDLCDEAWFLNRGEVSVPFSRAVSLLKRDTDSE